MCVEDEVAHAVEVDGAMCVRATGRSLRRVAREVAAAAGLGWPVESCLAVAVAAP